MNAHIVSTKTIFFFRTISLLVLSVAACTAGVVFETTFLEWAAEGWQKNQHQTFWVVGVISTFAFVIPTESFMNVHQHGISSLLRYLRGQESWGGHELADYEPRDMAALDRRLLLLMWPFVAFGTGMLVSGLAWTMGQARL